MMRTIAVTSGKGGVGKTSMTINLGCALTNLGKRVVLFDADLQLANLDVALGIETPYNLQHIVAGQRTLSEIVADGPGGLKVVAGASAVAPLMQAGSKRIAMFMSQVDDIVESTDFLLFDTAAGLDKRVFAFLKRADEVLVVVTPEPTSVTDAFASIKVLCRKDPDATVRILVNRAPSEHVGLATFKALKTTVQSFLDLEVLSAGYVLYDKAFESASLKRKAAYLQYPDSPGVKSLDRIAAELTVQAQPTVLYESAAG